MVKTDENALCALVATHQGWGSFINISRACRNIFLKLDKLNSFSKLFGAAVGAAVELKVRCFKR